MDDVTKQFLQAYALMTAGGLMLAGVVYFCFKKGLK